MISQIRLGPFDSNREHAHVVLEGAKGPDIEDYVLNSSRLRFWRRCRLTPCISLILRPRSQRDRPNIDLLLLQLFSSLFKLCFQLLNSLSLIELIVNVITRTIRLVEIDSTLLPEYRIRILVLCLCLLSHLLNLEIIEVLVLCHQILNGFIHLFPGLDDHVIDVHVSLGAVGLLLGEVALFHFLNSLKCRALTNHVHLFCLCHLLSLLL